MAASEDPHSYCQVAVGEYVDQSDQTLALRSSLPTTEQSEVDNARPGTSRVTQPEPNDTQQDLLPFPLNIESLLRVVFSNISYMFCYRKFIKAAKNTVEKEWKNYIPKSTGI